MNVIEFILVQGQPQIRKYECILLPVPDMASCVCCQVTDDRVHSLFPSSDVLFAVSGMPNRWEAIHISPEYTGNRHFFF
jgi:hypothetical protein